MSEPGNVMLVQTVLLCQFTMVRSHLDQIENHV